MTRQLVALVIVALIPTVGHGQGTDEGSNEKASYFERAFGFHEPMFFAIGACKPDENDFYTGAGETFIRYDLQGSGFIFGMALSR